MDVLITEYIELSDNMRNGYVASLGKASAKWEQILSAIIKPVPLFVREIYSRWAGTHRNITNQQYMDFIPGYRLIHIEELFDEHYSFLNVSQLDIDNICKAKIDVIIPILADYGSSYVCYVRNSDNREYICSYSPDQGFVEMHCSIEAFLKTIIAFYKENVYFLDEDSFLDYSVEEEGVIGMKYNPDVRYWIMTQQ